MQSVMWAAAVAALLIGGASLAQAQPRTSAAANDNQAVVTTTANAPAPAKGANSFTMVEARNRLEKDGFSNVGDLRKDDNGVWHAQAQKDGSATPVWLDYKGNVGEGK